MYILTKEFPVITANPHKMLQFMKRVNQFVKIKMEIQDGVTDKRRLVSSWSNEII